MTTTTETRADGTVVTYRYGVPFGEEPASRPVLRRSAKKAVEAAERSGWLVEFTTETRGGGNLHVHLFPESPTAWLPVAEAKMTGPSGRGKWVVPVRVDLLFDAETGAYFGGTAYSEWEGPLNSASIYSSLGDGISGVISYVEFPGRWIDRAAADAKREVERAARQEIRLATRREFLADTDNHYAIAKLQEFASEPKSPNLQDERTPRDVLRVASAYATALVVKRLAESVLDRIGWTEEDGTVITVSAAIAQAVAEVSRSYEKNEAEAETLGAIAKFLDQYWGKAS